MLQRFAVAGMLCVGWAVAGCSGDSLEDFSDRTLVIQTAKQMGDERYLFSVKLQPQEPPSGCPSLHSGVEATLNGERLELYRGGLASDPGSPDAAQSGGPCAVPSGALWVDASRFQSEQSEDAVVEFRDGDRRMVAEFRNYFGRHTLARGETPLTVKPGQEVFLAWSPATDDLVGMDTLFLNRTTFLQARPEAGGVRVTLPEGLAAGSATVLAVGMARIPLVRCEGVAACEGSIPTQIYTEQVLDIQVQP